jgi:hypothetical protein
MSDTDIDDSNIKITNQVYNKEAQTLLFWNKRISEVKIWVFVINLFNLVF